jgi:hypothetical protein
MNVYMMRAFRDELEKIAADIGPERGAIHSTAPSFGAGSNWTPSNVKPKVAPPVGLAQRMAQRKALMSGAGRAAQAGTAAGGGIAGRVGGAVIKAVSKVR